MCPQGFVRGGPAVNCRPSVEVGESHPLIRWSRRRPRARRRAFSADLHIGSIFAESQAVARIAAPLRARRGHRLSFRPVPAGGTAPDGKRSRASSGSSRRVEQDRPRARPKLDTAPEVSFAARWCRLIGSGLSNSTPISDSKREAGLLPPATILCHGCPVPAPVLRRLRDRWRAGQRASRSLMAPSSVTALNLQPRADIRTACRRAYVPITFLPCRRYPQPTDSPTARSATVPATICSW